MAWFADNPSAQDAPLGAREFGSADGAPRFHLLREILSLLLALIALLMLLALVSQARQFTTTDNWIGTVGAAVAQTLTFIFGRYVAFALPVMLGLSAVQGLRAPAPGARHLRHGGLRGLGGLFILIVTCALLALSVPPSAEHYAVRTYELGGLVGNLLISPAGLNLVTPLGRVGAALVFGALSLIGLVLFTERMLRDLLGSVWRVGLRIGQWLGDIGVFDWLGALLPTRLASVLARIFGALGRIHLFSRLHTWLSGISFRDPMSDRLLRDGAGGMIVGLEADASRQAIADETDQYEPQISPEPDDVYEAQPAFLRRLKLFGGGGHRQSSVLGGMARTGARYDTRPHGSEEAEDDAPGNEDEIALGTEGEEDYATDGTEAESWEDAENEELVEEDVDAPSPFPSLQHPDEPPPPEGQLDLLGAMPEFQVEPMRRNAKPKRRRDDHDDDSPAFLPRPYRLPGLDLLSDPPLTMWEMSEEEQLRLSQKIEQTLAQFKVEVQVIEVIQGPVITRFALKVAPGVRVNRILALENELAMALKAQHVRILAPIPGQAAVGIEVPNKKANPVLLKELMASGAFQSGKSPLSFALGKNISGEPVVCDLAQMPHLLIAGATGSGKSVCLNTIIASLLYRNKPDKVKFVMVDPKRVELSIYQAIPHLLAPVVSECKKAAAALAWCVEQMESRYKLLAEVGVRNLDGYNALLNEKVPSKKTIGRELKFLPHIVIIIDELADLMMVSKNEVEEYIIRLAQMARAVGMHLVLATQRPSVNVITGIIKANFPSRIAFQVSSKVDSRTILDMNGAEALMGKGDMLYSPGGAKPFRIQGCFVSDSEVERLADFIRAQEKARYEKEDFEARPTPAERAKANLTVDEDREAPEVGNGLDFSQLHPLLRPRGGAVLADGAEGSDEELIDLAIEGRAAMAPLTPADMESLSDEALYNMALKLVLESRKGSVSYIQRRLKIGYARAGRIMDLMEERGIVGPYQGSKPRDLLVDPRAYLAKE